MKAMRLAGSDQGAELVLREIPEPRPSANEVLVRVVAAGVTPTELVWYPTSHDKQGGPRTGAVPSHEFSGVIAGLGDGVTGLTVGQEVYGMNDWFADGALAEYCLARPEWIAPKPKSLNHAEAASVPIGALTAWQGLFNRAKLQTGETVLVHGGAGAVGIFAIQLAHARGARVTTTVSAHNIALVKDLGANYVIDYKQKPFEDEVRDVDVVFDTVGGDTLRRSWGVLKPNGRMVTIAASGEAESDEKTKSAFFIVEADNPQLAEVQMRIDAGELRTVVDAVVPFAEAAGAYAGTLKRSARGKVVVMVAEPGRTHAAP